MFFNTFAMANVAAVAAATNGGNNNSTNTLFISKYVSYQKIVYFYFLFIFLLINIELMCQK